MNINEQEKDFLYGFALGANLTQSEAAEQWAGFSRQLSDREREALENNGRDEGFTQGQWFSKLYPATPHNKTKE